MGPELRGPGSELLPFRASGLAGELLRMSGGHADGGTGKTFPAADPLLPTRVCDDRSSFLAESRCRWRRGRQPLGFREAHPASRSVWAARTSALSRAALVTPRRMASSAGVAWR